MTKFFSIPFGAAGDLAAVPNATQPDGSVSYAQGFGPDYQRKTDGTDPLAKAVPRNSTNAIFNDITGAVGEIQLNGYMVWQSTAAPYPVNAIVRHEDVNWISLVDNNSTTPGATGASWANASYAPKLAAQRAISISGAASGSGLFDGSANLNIPITLSDIGVIAGTYTKVTINSKGLVIGSQILVPADIPSLDWSKITTGKPTTLSGYGITDGASGVGGVANSAAKLATARTIAISGAATGSASFDGSANATISMTLVDNGVVPGSYPKVTVNAKGLVIGSQALVQGDIPNLDWSKITSGKPNTLEGYGIVNGMRYSDKATDAEITGFQTVNRYLDPAGTFLLSQEMFAGMVFYTASSAPPSGSVKANGQALSRTGYARLFARIGTTFGAGDGSTTFNVPDLRGEFMRAWDDGRGVDNLRAFGSFQNGTLVAADDPAVDGIGGVHLTAGSDPASFGADRLVSGSTVFPSAVPGQTSAVSTWSVIHGTARPRNIAMLACIKF